MSDEIQEQFKHNPDPRRQIAMLRGEKQPDSPVAKSWIANNHAEHKVRGVMNKTETAYARDLDMLKAAGTITSYHYEAVTFRLTTTHGKRRAMRITVDFMVVFADGHIEFHEVKGGYATQESINRLKMAAELYPFKFLLVTRNRSCWITEEF